MSRFFFLVFSIVVFHTQRSSEHNILGLFPHFGFSHFQVFYPVLRGLAERGHNVTVVTYIANTEPHPNYRELLLTGKRTVNNFTLDRFTVSRSLPVLLAEYFALHNEGQQSCEDFYKSGFVEEILGRHASHPYDLVITEYFNTDCYMGVPYVLQIPVVGISSCALMPWYYDRILLPDTPSYVQSEFIGFQEVLLWQHRLLNFVQSRMNKLLYRYHTNYKDNQVIRKYLNVDMDVDEFASNSTQLIFVNQHYSLSGNRPLTPQLIEIGGIHIDDRNINASLSSEIEDFLQKSPTAVLFISWGSMLRFSSIAQTQLNAIVKVLENMQLRIVWKWEDDKKPIESDQFLFIKWAPQLTLLCHPKVKLFWGHGGLLGVTEAVHCAKPMILTPIYGDQFLNAYAVENRKIGKILHYEEIEKNQIKIIFDEIMKPIYSVNAQSISKVFRNRESSPLNTTLWWIEHLLRYGPTAGVVLRTKATCLNWFVYYSVDSVILLSGAVPLLLTTVWLLLAAGRWHFRKVVWFCYDFGRDIFKITIFTFCLLCTFVFLTPQCYWSEIA